MFAIDGRYLKDIFFVNVFHPTKVNLRPVDKMKIAQLCESLRNTNLV